MSLFTMVIYLGNFPSVSFCLSPRIPNDSQLEMEGATMNGPLQRGGAWNVFGNMDGLPDYQ